MSVPPLALAFALAASAGATAALARIAEHRGFSDDPAFAPERKLQPHGIPPVGGAAILVGLVAASAATGALAPAAMVWSALVLALAVGFVDDRTPGGLQPAALLAGQSIVAAALVMGGWRLFDDGSPLVLAASFMAVIAAMNAVNTFDNADGAASSLGILGLATGSPSAAASLLGFLPFNLWLRRDRAPLAYLGNSGSHLLGVLLVADPIARAALVLPLLDLARLVVVRRRAGAPPWKGDRRHLAHRLQNAGLSPTIVVVLMLAIAVPSVLGGRASAAEGGSLLPLATGIALSSLAFTITIFATREPQ
ncbi:MAG: MraY family glycosyltransferase [Planctomycetota bacterium]